MNTFSNQKRYKNGNKIYKYKIPRYGSQLVLPIDRSVAKLLGIEEESNLKIKIEESKSLKITQFSVEDIEKPKITQFSVEDIRKSLL